MSDYISTDPQRQERAEDLYVHPEEVNTKRSNHQRKYGIGSVRDAVLQHMYDKYEQMIVNEQERKGKTVKLHRGKGAKYLSEGREVIAFDIAGSGFSQFRADYKGMHGKKDGVRPYGEKKYTGKNLIGSDGKFCEIPVKWYNKVGLFNKIFGTNTPEKIAELNAARRQEYAKLRAHYGENVEYDGRVKKHILKKVKEKDGVKKTRYTMAGPGSVGKGFYNAGQYSIGHIRDYMLHFAKQHLTEKFRQYREMEADNVSPEDMKETVFQLRGHSRGGVAVLEGAMAIKKWVHDNYPQYEHLVKFDITQYDPVPGPDGSFRHDVLVDIKKEGNVSNRLRSLGDSAISTVVYSIHTDKSVFFRPQEVNSDRIIVTTGKHSVNLEKGDFSQGSSHRLAYTDPRTGEVYRNSGLSELPPGFYFADENNNLLKADTYEEAVRVIDNLVKDTHLQRERHRRLKASARAWFERENQKSAVEKYRDHNGRQMFEYLSGEKNREAATDPKRNEQRSNALSRMMEYEDWIYKSDFARQVFDMNTRGLIHGLSDSIVKGMAAGFLYRSNGTGALEKGTDIDTVGRDMAKLSSSNPAEQAEVLGRINDKLRYFDNFPATLTVSQIESNFKLLHGFAEFGRDIGNEILSNGRFKEALRQMPPQERKHFNMAVSKALYIGAQMTAYLENTLEGMKMNGRPISADPENRATRAQKNMANIQILGQMYKNDRKAYTDKARGKEKNPSATTRKKENLLHS